MPRIPAERRLGELAARLKPDQAPFYIRPPVAPGLEGTYPAPGWYWRPHGHPVAVYLGYNFEIAAVTLHRLLQEQEEAA